MLIGLRRTNISSIKMLKCSRQTYGQNGWDPNQGQLGCFVSHHMIWKKSVFSHPSHVFKYYALVLNGVSRRMLDENIASSLVLESDADWDMRIKTSLTGFRDGVKAILDTIPSVSGSHSGDKRARELSDDLSSSASPYGQNWDLLWIGHCGAQADRYYAYHDPSAADNIHAWSFSPPPPEIQYRPAETRFVFQLSDHGAAGIVCTTGYAISNRGAQKLEKMYPNADHEVDIWLRWVCSEEPGMVCLSSFPQIVSMAGGTPSNIGDDNPAAAGTVNPQDVRGGPGVQISARVNAALGLAEKGPDAWKREWDDLPLWSFDNGATREGTKKMLLGG